MKRRDFVQLTGMGLGAMMLPFSTMGSNIAAEALLEPGLDVAAKKILADVALNTARNLGASYADARIGRYLNQYVFTREDKVQNVVNTESFGIGIRVIADGTWGFASTNDVTEDGIKKATSQAVAIAKANAKIQKEPVQLAPVEAFGEVSWKTPIKKDFKEVPVSQKVELLLDANSAAMNNGANFVNSSLFMVNEQKYFASTDGSYIDQDIHRIWPTFDVTAIDRTAGKFKSRSALSAPMGMGYEYLDGLESEKLVGPAGLKLYRNSYDIIEDATLAAKQAKEMLTAESVQPGKYDLVLEPNHLGLTIHESVGHPLELDRVLGYEANYAGTSFATLDKWKSGDFKYGSDKVNIVADKTQPHSLGAVGYDDEGVKTKKWDLIRNGILVNYEAIRDQVKIIDQNESHGCCYAQSWNDVQFQRMPNVSLEPGKEKYSVEEMIKDVEKGIYIAGRGSYSIDQQRYNFQFGGTVFYEIKDGKIVGMLNDVAYQSNTQEFWNSCVKICDESDYRLFGSFFDGKGQPSQVSAVSHGSSTSRFKDVNVINTGRSI
ncbi:MAG: TldD/PmbA family protein [Zunongwangia sp.]|jgi:TldD protein|uniref:Modulator of DNA gyrase n=2 Tax=Zunongwangia profunda TaxID=398743 RepID=D5B9X1_ZUNPS|nr:TldD/PmbA family protein [Zunongwangia profunda]MAC66132.1 TldD/PmbA family protein [Flavobacteriaceae bacterium]MAO37293.1 TldD/PmbA family protein [Zunongwangia sp.]ADF52269.1 putative modulator of DNA gyrase [Zunongwangia profunda SM-A87]MAG88321.1 TldD/PmbA family protein [Flavobacteriaceae bacterium]MAS71030.1 TldD/PmbA family protein [Zunongwangia sp.]|tara:strand:+ start:1713 stop:3353 length:1641 start_codon:yes stop_codon:yes gene_type:complete